VRAATPCESAGIEMPPVAARLPAPANPFKTVLRSIEPSHSFSIFIAIAPQTNQPTNGEQASLLANDMPASTFCPLAQSQPKRALSGNLCIRGDHITFHPA
jgi:hypothetical protein